MTEVLLKELNNSDINWINSTGRRQEINPGAILIQEGKTDDYLHILLDGILKVSISQADKSPLTRAFAAIEENENSDREIARLSSGEVVGEVPFISYLPKTTSVSAVEKSLVMSVPKQALAEKLQQDINFAARFYRAVAIMFSDRLQNIINQLGRKNFTRSQPIKDVLCVLGELHDSDTDWIMAVGTPQKIAANTVLIHQGGVVDALYILLGGAMSVSISEDERNPLTRAFAAIEGNKVFSTEIGRISKGEIIGETPFIDGRLPLTTVKAMEDSLVLAIPRQRLAAKLQQDVGFAARFYRVIVALLSYRLQEIYSQLGCGKSKVELRQGMKLRADDYLTKPSTAEELLGAIAARLERQTTLKQCYENTNELVAAEFQESASFESFFPYCPKLTKVFNFIEANYHHAITLSDVAKAVGYSGAYLTDLVKRQTGKTVQCWIIKRRIEAACCLLLNTDRSICEIAEAVGYNDKNYFFYQFRQYYGTTPQIWRKMQRSSLKSETNSSLTEKFSIVS
jgi:bacteriocin-type transport-associated protein